MTGFGKASLQLPTKKITVEIKSLNSKGLDLNVRLPQVYRDQELPLRNMIAEKLERGKVDFSIYAEANGEETSSKINAPIVKSYIAQMQEVIPHADVTELMKMAVRMPDALKTEREELNEEEWESIAVGIQEALNHLQQFRIDEGKSLENEFLLRIQNIGNFLQKVVPFEGERKDTVKNKLLQALEDLRKEVDQNRLEQELIFYLEKYDITEEKVRLQNHLEYFVKTMKEAAANGRKLGFITQEIGREINTLGSKANHSEIQKLVVQMKDELEKIKEQVLNVL